MPMKAKHQRLLFIIISLVVLGAAIGLVLRNFEDNLVFFYSPSELLAKKEIGHKTVRVGGMVKEGSVVKDTNSQKLIFTITDFENEITIEYQGITPGLFREKQGMVAKGHLTSDGSFKAIELLAKHDENYMPPEVKDILNKKEAAE